MGRATLEAQHTLHLYPKQQTMQAVVYVKSPQTYYQGICSFDEGKGEHVELMLMQMLSERYQSYDHIPDGSTIIFAAKWSPCKNCTNDIIPGFLKLLNLSGRPLRVKFRYDEYYAVGHWTFDCKNPANLWSNSHEAETAYQNLSKQYGDYAWINQSVSPHTNAITSTAKSKLVFARSIVHKTSTRHTWFV